MANPNQNVQALTPEMLAVQELDATAGRLFAELPVKPLDTYSYPEGFQGTIDRVYPPDRFGSSDSLKRLTGVDGTVTYVHNTLWHGGDDRGSFDTAWRKGGSSLTETTTSETYGVTSSTQVDVADRIAAFRTQLEKSFTPPEVKQEVSEGMVRRFLGRVAVYRQRRRMENEFMRRTR